VTPLKSSQGPPAAPDPRCACCGDAYGTKWLCPTCRRDPANASWAEADEAETSSAAPPDDRGVAELVGAPEARVWNPTPTQRAVLRCALEGAKPKAIATVTGSSEQYVRRVLKEFKLQGKR
jgi:hypothetical protein